MTEAGTFSVLQSAPVGSSSGSSGEREHGYLQRWKRTSMVPVLRVQQGVRVIPGARQAQDETPEATHDARVNLPALRRGGRHRQELVQGTSSSSSIGLLAFLRRLNLHGNRLSSDGPCVIRVACRWPVVQLTSPAWYRRTSASARSRSPGDAPVLFLWRPRWEWRFRWTWYWLKISNSMNLKP